MYGVIMDGQEMLGTFTEVSAPDAYSHRKMNGVCFDRQPPKISLKTNETIKSFRFLFFVGGDEGYTNLGFGVIKLNDDSSYRQFGKFHVLHDVKFVPAPEGYHA